ncbi:MAG: hypothetical protein VKO21_05400 [Candidatus Sericytochromatia bacterium]|nr:hypothetical protein [Candidatus Sericytochromatia bacterium]
MSILAIHCRDLFDRGRLEAMATAAGLEARSWPVETDPGWCLVNLSEPDAFDAAREAREAGWRVLAFAPHVRADLFARAREEGFEACARSGLDKVFAARTC